MCYKIVLGLTDVHREDFFETSATTHTKRHRYKLFEKRHHGSIRLSFFCERVVKIRNNLPADIVVFSSVAAFKRSIYNVDFTNSLQRQLHCMYNGNLLIT